MANRLPRCIPSQKHWCEHWYLTVPLEELKNPRDGRNKEDRSKRVGRKGSAVKSGIFPSYLGNDHLSWREMASTGKEAEVSFAFLWTPTMDLPQWIQLQLSHHGFTFQTGNWRLVFQCSTVAENTMSVHVTVSVFYWDAWFIHLCLVLLYHLIFNFMISLWKTFLYIFQCICCFLLYLRCFQCVYEVCVRACVYATWECRYMCVMVCA